MKKTRGFQLNWQFALLIGLIFIYSAFCTYDFYNDLKEQSELKSIAESNNELFAIKEFVHYSELANEPLSLMAIEWLAGLSASILALFLILRGQKATIKDAEKSLKIELLSKRINKLTQDNAPSKGFYSQMEKQFDDWELTKSESDVAILLLKGLSFKEMSDIKGNSEKTLRHQASNVYSKSGLKGRSEFSAYFLEEVLAFDEKDSPDLRQGF